MLLAGSILELEIGSSHDEVVVLGDARLAGTLRLSFLDGWMPEAGNAVTLLDVRGERTGNFGDLLQQGWPSGLRYGLDFESGRLMLTASPVPEPLSAFLMLSGLAVLIICRMRQRSSQPTAHSLGNLAVSRVQCPGYSSARIDRPFERPS